MNRDNAEQTSCTLSLRLLSPLSLPPLSLSPLPARALPHHFISTLSLSLLILTPLSLPQAIAWMHVLRWRLVF